MSDAVMSERIGRQVCEALGLTTSRVVKLTMTLEIGRPVTVLVTERYVSGDEVAALTEVLSRYELHLKERL